jgi:hypothetical protein
MSGTFNSQARTRLRSYFAMVVMVLACGGPSTKVPTTTAGDAGADASLPTHLVSTLPTDVKNPPPFNLGSKHAVVKAHADWGDCHAAFHPMGDPAKAVDALANGCAAVTQMRGAASALMSGSQNATSSQPTAYKFRGQAKHCYRLYGVAGASVKSLVAVVTDADGAEIAEYHTDDVTPYIAPDEAMCFTDDADAQVVVSVGIGDGPYALAVWGT